MFELFYLANRPYLLCMTCALAKLSEPCMCSYVDLVTRLWVRVLATDHRISTEYSPEIREFYPQPNADIWLENSRYLLLSYLVLINVLTLAKKN